MPGKSRTVPTCPEAIGLTTYSGYYELNFCASCRLELTFGTWDYRDNPCVSRITDEEIREINTIDPKETILLLAVENRAVVRKLAGKLPPEIRQKVCLVGFDGQVRSSAYRFLEMWQQGGIKKFIAWTDYDRPALFMLKKLASLNFRDFWVVVPEPEGLALKSYHQAAAQMEKSCDKSLLLEQESYLKDIGLIVDLVMKRI